MSHNPDQLTIDKVMQGDNQAFAALIERYQHMVFTLALKIVKNREDAEEVAQDVFINAFRALRNYKGDAKFSTWLYKIAYYKSLDYVKRNKSQPETLSIDISGIYNIGALDEALESMEASDRKSIIRKAMDQLPAADSVLITLYYFESLSLEEISVIMGISANTAKVRLFRGRKRLADILKNHLDLEMIRNYERG